MIHQHRHQVHRSGLVIGLLLLALLLSTWAGTTAAQPRDLPTTLTGILWISPLNQPGRNVVEPGERFQLDVRVENVGEGPASNIEVRIPYNRDLYLITSSEDTVLNDDEFGINVEFLPPDDFVTVPIVARVRETMRVPARIYMEGNFSWEDELTGGSGTTNQVELLVDYVDDDDDNDGNKEAVITRRDTVPPESCFLAIEQRENGYVLAWSGSDNLSGIRSYDVQARKLPDGVWREWMVDTSLNSDWFGPTNGTPFAFRIRATDRQGNNEPWPINAQIKTLQADFTRDRCPGSPGDVPR